MKFILCPVIIVVLVLLNIISCRKIVKSPYYIHPQLKDWFWIDTGSYFLYQDSGGTIDSVYVQQINHYIREYREHHSRVIFNDQIYECILSNGFLYKMEAPRYQIELVPSNYYYANGIILLDIYDRAVSGQYKEQVLSQHTLPGLTVDSTIVWSVNNDRVLQTEHSRYYFSKGIGITEYIDLDRNIHKKLIKYHINKCRPFPE